MSIRIISQKRLKKILHYDPKTGIFTRLISVSNVKIGDVAGYLDPSGYWLIKVNCRRYQAHRLAFLYMTGKFPADQVDHINHSCGDNRWENLRQATHTTNGRNQSMRSTNTSGFMGVSWDTASSKWIAQIMANGKKKHLGCFTKIEDATAARKKAEPQFGYHENHGLRSIT